MLHLFRRHLRSCPQKEKGRNFKRCKCPVWIDGYLDGVRVLQSAKTDSWERAQDKAAEWQKQGYPGDPKPATSLTPAYVTEQFLSDAAARNLQPSSIKKYRVLFDQFSAFCESRGVNDIRKLTLPLTREFRQSWADSPISATKKLERLRAFLKFCQANGWTENYAAQIKAPIIEDPPTLPFNADEMKRLLDNCDTRMRAFVLLLRYSGLRIGDGASLSKDKIVERRLTLRTQKTDTHVSILLPQAVIDALGRVQSKSARYWFWTGEGKIETLTGNFRRSFRRIAKLAGIQNAHPHRLRDTFAVEALNAGYPVELVSQALGHEDIKTTLDHYLPWVKSRQDTLDAATEKAHANDPLLLTLAPKTNLLRRVK